MSKKDKNKVSFFDMFDIIEDVEKPYRVYLEDKETGEKTEEWIDIVGCDSKQYRIAELRQNRYSADVIRGIQRRGLDIEGKEAEDIYDDHIVDKDIYIASACIVDWSASELCIPENTEKLMFAKREIADAILEYARDRSIFLSRNESNSTDGPKKSLSFPKPTTKALASDNT